VVVAVEVEGELGARPLVRTRLKQPQLERLARTVVARHRKPSRLHW